MGRRKINSNLITKLNNLIKVIFTLYKKEPIKSTKVTAKTLSKMENVITAKLT